MPAASPQPRLTRLAPIGVAFLVVAIFAFAVIASVPEFRARAARQEIIQELTAELAQGAQQERDLKDQIAAVKADPNVLERLAREKFGFGRTGELIFRFEAPAPPRPLPASPAVVMPPAGSPR
ncbi:MAG TPA: septum formation initiator family protein [Verrucomicrobiota bacterium]|nr:septum formation initiator family protein [Verrucomicrobiota bacterium]